MKAIFAGVRSLDIEHHRPDVELKERSGRVPERAFCRGLPPPDFRRAFRRRDFGFHVTAVQLSV